MHSDPTPQLPFLTLNTKSMHGRRAIHGFNASVALEFKLAHRRQRIDYHGLGTGQPALRTLARPHSP